jgi:hypothetical protein
VLVDGVKESSRLILLELVWCGGGAIEFKFPRKTGRGLVRGKARRAQAKTYFGAHLWPQTSTLLTLASCTRRVALHRLFRQLRVRSTVVPAAWERALAF